LSLIVPNKPSFEPTPGIRDGVGNPNMLSDDEPEGLQNLRVIYSTQAVEEYGGKGWQ
jgi:hypothetical protein